MEKINISKLVFRVSLLLCAVSVLVLGLEIFSFWEQQKTRTETIKNNAQKEARRAARELEEKLRKLQDTTDAIAKDVTEGKLRDEQLLERVKKELEQNPDFLEVGAGYEPFAYSSRRRLYAPYYTRKNNKINLEHIENSYDYTERSTENEWYHSTLQKGTNWNEPYFDRASDAIIALYSSAFYKIDPQTQEKKPAGIIFSDFSLEKLNSLVKSLNVGTSGYGFLLSKKGVYLAHPQQQYAKEQRSIFKLAEKYKNKQLQLIGEKAIKGEKAVVDLVNDITGQSSWIFIEPIGINGWSLGVVTIKDDIQVGEHRQEINRRPLIRIVLEAVLFLFFLSMVVCRVDRANRGDLWIISSACGFFCAVGTGSIWYLVLTQKSYENTNYLVLNKSAVDNILEPETKLDEKLKQNQPILIPTGIFIHTLKFNSSNDVFITGYIWQKYYKGVHDGLIRGFLLPEGYDIEIQEYFNLKKQDSELIGWYFEGTLRQSFDFTQYPFDYNNILLRLWPKNFSHPDTNQLVFLTPDFSSYEVLNPTTKPGLIDKIATETWQIDRTFFQYQFTNFSTNFGEQGSPSLKAYPELYFTVVLKRGFIGIIISRIIPISVVAILLFIILLLTSDNGLELVATAGGLIFVLIVDQTGLRGQIAANGIIYLEYFYFVLYLLILLVAMNAILANSKVKIPLMEYRNNLIPKLLYWPSLLGTLLLITALVFY